MVSAVVLSVILSTWVYEYATGSASAVGDLLSISIPPPSPSLDLSIFFSLSLSLNLSIFDFSYRHAVHLLSRPPPQGYRAPHGARVPAPETNNNRMTSFHI